MTHKSWFLNSSTKHFLVKNRSTQKWAFNYGKRSELTNKDIKVHLVEVTINFEVDLIHPLTNRAIFSSFSSKNSYFQTDRLPSIWFSKSLTKYHLEIKVRISIKYKRVKRHIFCIKWWIELPWFHKTNFGIIPAISAVLKLQNRGAAAAIII